MDVFELNGKFWIYAVGADGAAMGDPKGGPFDSKEQAFAALDQMSGQGAPAMQSAPAAAPQRVTKSVPAQGGIISTVSQAEYAALKSQFDALNNKVEAMKAAGVGRIEAGRGPNDGKPFSGLGEHLMAIKAVAKDPGAATQTERNKLEAVGKLPEVKSSLGITTSVDSDGAFLLQPTEAAGLLERAYEQSDVLSQTQRQVVGANSDSYIVKQIDETSRASGSRFGGLTVKRIAPGEDGTASRPKFKRTKVELSKLVAFCYADDEALEDAVQLESEINRLYPLEFDFVVQNELFNGAGGGEMLGVWRSPAVVSVAKEPGQGARTIEYNNVLNMWSRMWSASWNKAVWYVNQDTLPQLYTMKIPVGTGGLPVFLPPSGASGSPYATLFGRPIKPIEQAATLGSVGDISLIDFSQFITITKGGLKTAASIHVQFISHQTLFRFTTRINGIPLWNSSLTPASGSTNKLSPYITLAERA